MSSRRKFLLALTGLVLMLLTACGPAQTATKSPTVLPIEPTLTPSPAIDESELIGAQNGKSSPDVVAACNPAEQISPLNPGLPIDLDMLGLDTCYDLVFDLTSGNQFYSGSAKITYTNPGAGALNDIMLRTFPNSPVILAAAWRSPQPGSMVQTSPTDHPVDTTTIPCRS